MSGIAKATNDSMVTKLHTAIGRVSPRARKNASQLKAMCPSAATSPKAAMIPTAGRQRSPMP